MYLTSWFLDICNFRHDSGIITCHRYWHFQRISLFILVFCFSVQILSWAVFITDEQFVRWKHKFTHNWPGYVLFLNSNYKTSQKKSNLSINVCTHSKAVASSFFRMIAELHTCRLTDRGKLVIIRSMLSADLSQFLGWNPNLILHEMYKSIYIYYIFWVLPSIRLCNIPSITCINWNLVLPEICLPEIVIIL